MSTKKSNTSSGGVFGTTTSNTEARLSALESVVKALEEKCNASGGGDDSALKGRLDSIEMNLFGRTKG